jgi:Uroporphyrinogen decarboxylase (URO-D)
MNSFERIDAAIGLRPTDQTPVSPLLISYPARCAGVKMAEMYSRFRTWFDALDSAEQVLGHFDTVFPFWPRDVCRLQMLTYRLPGRDLPDDEIAQMIEAEVMKREDYERIVAGKFTQWYYEYLARMWELQVRYPLCMPLVIPRLLAINNRSLRVKRRWERRGVPTNFDAAIYPPFDLFSLARSIGPFFYDLYDCPDLVEAAMRAAMKDNLDTIKIPLRIKRGSTVCIYPMRSSASFISTQFFERFALPYLKEIVETLHRAGLRCVIHCDGNWTRMLPYFRELPGRSCIIEFDGLTDIFQAKAVLGDHLCLKGDVPATLLATGSRDDVLDYCHRLIKEVGHGGGFILSSGCEVPSDAPLENVRAIIDAAMGTV